MEALNLHCPSCGAIVDVPDGIDTFYCSHCGTKLLISGQDSETLNAKVRLKIAEKKLDLEYKDKELKRQHELEKNRQTQTLFLVLLVMIFIVISIFMFLVNQGWFSWSWMIRKTLGF